MHTGNLRVVDESIELQARVVHHAPAQIDRKRAAAIHRKRNFRGGLLRFFLLLHRANVIQRNAEFHHARLHQHLAFAVRGFEHGRFLAESDKLHALAGMHLCGRFARRVPLHCLLIEALLRLSHGVSGSLHCALQLFLIDVFDRTQLHD
ncbi:hypothetical protein SDC9_197414 [bioreactor metagenome]|uniref:Uncharacterized protein n=1 Tax=bioreactor metagenome TaxID=1076179 RepID=A0A645IG28_9ZZZZ